MEAGDSRPIRLLVVESGESGSVAEDLDIADRPSPSVVTVASVTELTDALDADTPVDCVVTRYDIADGTGADALDRVVERRPDVPVVLVVDAGDGRVPVEAVSRDFAACVPLDGREPASDRLREAVDDAVGDGGPSIPGRLPPSGCSLESWKASVLDQLFERFPLHVFVKDRDARIALVTEGPVQERVHPLGEQFRGNRDIDGVVPVREAIDSYVDDLHVIETGEQIVDKEEYFPSSGRWFLTTKVPLYDERDGSDAPDEVVGLLGITREITELKERELQLTALNHLVRHNLRNEVNVVRGWAETLSSAVEGPSKRDADRIVQASDRLCSTLDKQQEIVDLLTERPDRVVLDAAAVARRVADGVAARHADVRLDRVIPETAPVKVVEGFERVFVELVENAIVHNAQETPRVELRVDPRDEEVHVRVADDGPPIPEMEVATLTGERTIGPLYHGTGLGLWIVNWFVRRSGGTLSFGSNDPTGNVVVVTVPVAD
ncbi:ATP-binding protein [Salinigranum sp. GCM10025319]|uniref:sensor histidine kinase n=1 Tax=Salinigranum sp. GCM10025319 TaxID=3252687 RepID=UPI00360F446B